MGDNGYLRGHARPVPPCVVDKLPEHHRRHDPDFVGLCAHGQAPEEPRSAAFRRRKHPGVRRLRRRAIGSDRRHEGAKHRRVERNGRHYSNTKRGRV